MRDVAETLGERLGVSVRSRGPAEIGPFFRLPGGNEGKPDYRGNADDAVVTIIGDKATLQHEIAG